MKRFITLLLLLVGLLLAGAAGCADEEARCAQMCEHKCDICDQDCTEDDITACVNSCENVGTEPERADCVIAAQSCDDVWEC